MRDGKRIDVGGRRQRALLTLLAIDRGAVVSIDRLIDELWAGEPPPAAAVTIRSYVSRLRSALGHAAAIRASGAGYALETARDAVDAERFGELVRGADAALATDHPARAVELLDAALGLWRGEPFGGLGVDGRLRDEAERLREANVHAIEARIDARLELGAAAEVVEELEGLVRRYAFRERLWRQLMLALYRSDRQADALATYHRARAALDEELGLEPSEGLRELEAAILRQDVPQPRGIQAGPSIPLPLTSFVGRQAELAELGSLLLTDRLVSITGIGGVGKTRVALELARSHGADGGVAFIDLAPIDDPALVAREIAAAVGLPETPDADLGRALAGKLHEQPFLLVLDNCEHLLAACAHVAHDLLRTVTGLRILATSRVLLGVDGEVGYPLPPLSLGASAPDGRDNQAGGSDAVALFLDRARGARGGRHVTGEEAATAAAICADLDGLPLAIELAAARARALSIEDIASGIRDRFRFLVSWRRLASARHRTLHEAIEWSFELFSPEERALIAGLSVFRGGFDLAAIGAIVLGNTTSSAVELVERAVDASLLAPAASESGSVRYQLLETVREYAADVLEQTGSAGEIRARHARYYLSLAEAIADLVERELPLAPLTRLDVEASNLRIALAHLRAENDREAELRLCAALWRFWWLRGYLVEGRQAIEAALERTRDLPTPTRATALRGASTFASRQGDRAGAMSLAEEALRLSTEIDDVDGLGQALMVVGNAAADTGETERAAVLYERAAQTLRGRSASRDLAVLLLNQGDLALTLGDLETAERATRESLALARAAGDDAGISVLLTNLALVALRRDDALGAKRLAAEALGHAHRIGAVEWSMAAVAALAAAEVGLGEAEDAARSMGLADRLGQEIGASLEPYLREVHETTRARLREALGPAELERLTTEGRAQDSRSLVSDPIAPGGA